jgi:glycosyltransferase involved in cell wall biosynthesis
MVKNPFIVIPIYNEQSVIHDIVTGLLSHNYKNIIIIDDGSTDDVALKISTVPVYYARHLINRGKGSAVRTGMKIAKQKHSDCVVTIDGDGQHSIEDITTLIEKINQGYDIALGVRSFNTKEMPFIKVLANRIANIVIYVLFGLKVKDSQSGFKAYSKKALDLIHTSFDSYEHESEILSKIRQHRLSYAEVPIKTIYTTYSQTKARRQNITNGFRMIYKMIFFN